MNHLVGVKYNKQQLSAIYERLAEANQNTKTPVTRSELLRKHFEFAAKYPLCEVMQ